MDIRLPTAAGLQLAGLVSIEEQIQAVRQRLDKEAAEHKQLMAEYNAQLSLLEADKAALVNGALIDVFQIAEGVIDISSGYDRVLGVEDARKQILDNGGTLFHRYIGFKDYASYRQQRCDCEYGMGPSHGYIICRIGLTPSRRKGGAPLTGDEKMACLYALEKANEYASWLKSRNAARGSR